MPSAPAIFDLDLLKLRRARAARLPPADFLLTHVANDIAERLSVVSRKFPRALDLGTPGEALRPSLLSSGVGEIERQASIAEDKPLSYPEGSIDLVVSALALHFVNDLPGVLAQVRRALKPDGLFLAAMLGGDTLSELRQSFAEAESIVEGGVSPRVAPFADVRALGGLLQRAGFALPVVDSDRLTVRYDNPLALMHDLRRMGASNVMRERRRAPLRSETLAQMMQIYADNYSDADRRIRATFEIVWLSGWAPHESQQQPLKPGSAKISLKDVLPSRRSEEK